MLCGGHLHFHHFPPPTMCNDTLGFAFLMGPEVRLQDLRSDLEVLRTARAGEECGPGVGGALAGKARVVFEGTRFGLV